jgi:cation diffusion facilitator CzcD-associated flavoprotein CzcO
VTVYLTQLTKEAVADEGTYMSTVLEREDTKNQSIEHVDVVIVGAGISGIGTAYHLITENPERSFTVLEAQDSFGGTWHTHRYPGIRSDSDLYTFGYRFKPWTSAPIATAAEIQKYLGDVIAENELDRHIRYRHHIDSASWSSEDNRWTVSATRTDTGDEVYFSANFLWMCQGYYQHEEGYTPEWPGMERFQGVIVHPQTWPEDLDYRDKEVVVIGSGATAATLVPAIANDVAHVTILQRSPTYYFTGENRNLLADHLRELDVPEEWVHDIVRRENLFNLRALTQLALEEPEFAKDALIDLVRAALPPGFDVETHFTPRYMPWRQRIAFLPDGDLFKSISEGRASMVTDEIETFTERGVALKSGGELDADIIVTATGFNLSVLGEISFSIDGVPLDLANTVTYRGMMFTGVPNLVWVFGYFRASWTLRVDLVSDFVNRMLLHMDELGATRVTPQLRPEDQDEPWLEWVDVEYFNPNYLMRSMHLMPKRIDKPEWRHTQDYWAERDELPLVDLDDGCLVFE